MYSFPEYRDDVEKKVGISIKAGKNAKILRAKEYVEPKSNPYPDFPKFNILIWKAFEFYSVRLYDTTMYVIWPKDGTLLNDESIMHSLEVIFEKLGKENVFIGIKKATGSEKRDLILQGYQFVTTVGDVFLPFQGIKLIAARQTKKTTELLNISEQKLCILLFYIAKAYRQDVEKADKKINAQSIRYRDLENVLEITGGNTFISDFDGIIGTRKSGSAVKISRTTLLRAFQKLEDVGILDSAGDRKHKRYYLDLKKDYLFDDMQERLSSPLQAKRYYASREFDRVDWFFEVEGLISDESALGHYTQLMETPVHQYTLDKDDAMAPLLMENAKEKSFYKGSTGYDVEYTIAKYNLTGFALFYNHVFGSSQDNMSSKLVIDPLHLSLCLSNEQDARVQQELDELQNEYLTY